MAKRIDQLIVIDVEATCWNTKPPDGEESEIIEIGVCVLDVFTGERTRKKSILVRPWRSRVSAFCTELTTLTQAMVDEGIVFSEACELLRKEYKTHERAWASWGDYDRKMFAAQCQREGIAMPFGPTHINAKHLYSILRGQRRELGMAAALEQMKLPLEGTHHRGGDDAWNIALLLGETLRHASAGRAPQD